MRTLAQIGAVLGREFGFELLKQMSGLADDVLLDAIEETGLERNTCQWMVRQIAPQREPRILIRREPAFDRLRRLPIDPAKWAEVEQWAPAFQANVVGIIDQHVLGALETGNVPLGLAVSINGAVMIKVVG